MQQKNKKYYNLVHLVNINKLTIKIITLSNFFFRQFSNQLIFIFYKNIG